METSKECIICGNCVFYNNFDSANLARVEQVTAADSLEKAENHDGVDKLPQNTDSVEEKPDCEFNVWTKHDCHGTQYQNNNRTWFYFGVKPAVPGISVKFNVVNLNRQSKMFSQGMCPVFKIIPGHGHWERIRDKPTYAMDQKGSEFTLSFLYRMPDNPKAISYLAFTYPFTYQDLQSHLNRIDNRMAKRILLHPDDVYYHRECAIKSLEGRRLDMLTISSFHNISNEREDRLNGMFPDTADERAFKFHDKKVIFLSARVHPGETPSSFVFNGFLNFLLNRDEPIAALLRRIYVFKLIPMLNPDGVARGHYRVDTRGVNLNRVYLNPSPEDHPTIFAAKSLIRYYHNCYEIVDEPVSEETNVPEKLNVEMSKDDATIVDPTCSVTGAINDTTNRLLGQVTLMTLDETSKGEQVVRQVSTDSELRVSEEIVKADDKLVETPGRLSNAKCPTKNPLDSGLFLYLDLHGHASKKGIFMYGNYFDDTEDTIMCMLLPKIMSINNPNFHFTSCSFAERNMYLIDKRDGMSREGSGRVAVYKLTGLVRSYTLECNYNSGRLVNALPARIRDGNNKTPSHMFVPPKYTPTVFEEVGAALGPSILDLTNSNPNSRLPNSQYRSLRGVKTFLKLTCVNSHSASINRPRNKDNSGTVGKEAPRAASIVGSMNRVAPSEVEKWPKSGTSVASKPRIIRRTATSLYASIKRAKSAKKSRRVVSRKSTKNERTTKKENGPMTSAIKSSRRGAKATPLKPTGHRLAVESNDKNIGTIVSSPPVVVVDSSRRRANKPTLKDSTEKGPIEEETRAVKQGPKRLKIISPGMKKTRPEIGESSRIATRDENLISPLRRVVRFRNERKVKGTFGRCRKSCRKADNKTKPRKPSEPRAKSRMKV